MTKNIGNHPYVNVINQNGDGGYIVPEEHIGLFVHPQIHKAFKEKGIVEIGGNQIICTEKLDE